MPDHSPPPTEPSRLPVPDATAEGSRSLPRASAAGQAAPDPTSLFARVEGEAFFTRLVDAFYSRVAEDPVLRPLYPEEDLGPARERLQLFLVQYWGGPSTYSATRGHPRLRMRHAPFPVGSAQIEAWLSSMSAALEEVDPPADVREELWAYFERAASFMRNTPE